MGTVLVDKQFSEERGWRSDRELALNLVRFVPSTCPYCWCYPPGLTLIWVRPTPVSPLSS